MPFLSERRACEALTPSSTSSHSFPKSNCSQVASWVLLSDCSYIGSTKRERFPRNQASRGTVESIRHSYLHRRGRLVVCSTQSTSSHSFPKSNCSQNAPQTSSPISTALGSHCDETASVSKIKVDIECRGHSMSATCRSGLQGASTNCYWFHPDLHLNSTTYFPDTQIQAFLLFVRYFFGLSNLKWSITCYVQICYAKIYVQDNVV